ncbi:molybdenum cofactor guanylyltransferase, partial [Streptomyces rhizosphaericola]
GPEEAAAAVAEAARKATALAVRWEAEAAEERPRAEPSGEGTGTP